MTLRLGLLLVLDAGLALGIWSVATTPLDVSAIAPPQRPPAAAGDADAGGSDPAPAEMQALERNQVLARPLFAADRRAWAPPPPPPPLRAAPPAAAPPAAAPRLVGIGISGGRRRALLADPGTPDTLWVTEGETAWTWTVREIDARSVTVEQEGRRVALPLHRGPEDG